MPMITDLGQRLLDRWIYVLVKVGADFVLPFTQEGYRRILDSGEYGDDFGPYLDAWLSMLDGGKWKAGHYFPGKGYREALKSKVVSGLLPLQDHVVHNGYQDELIVDPAGKWFLGEKEVMGKVLSFFQSRLRFDPEICRYWIGYPLEGRIETRYIHHHSPPIRVIGIVQDADSFTVHLNTGAKERLNPGDLWLDRREELFCRVGEQRLPAWFRESARWEILKNGEDYDGGWRVVVGKEQILIPVLGE